MRAILALYALRASTGCYNDECGLTTALGLGEQCSDQQAMLINTWFKKDELRKLKSLDSTRFFNCVPDTATHQSTWGAIRVESHGKLVAVFTNGGWLGRNIAGSFSYKTVYRLGSNTVRIVSHKEYGSPPHPF